MCAVFLQRAVKQDEVSPYVFQVKPTQNRHRHQKTDFFRVRQGTVRNIKIALNPL